MSQEALDALQKTNFTHWDWAIAIGYLLISLLVGLWVKRYAVDMTNYITAGRGVGTWLGIATMTGTELGLITIMYSAEKGFKGGFAAFHIAIIAGFVTLFVGLTGFIVEPLRRFEVLTIPEFYEKRFGKPTRVFGGIVLAIGGILNMGLFLKVGSMFLVGVTGLSHTGWALPTVMTVLLVLVLVYTVLGGMISVIITDYIQFVVLSFGMVLVSLLAIYTLGWDNIFHTVQDQMGEKGFDPLVAEGHFGPEYVMWMMVLGLAGCAIWPTAVARALSMESTEAVKRMYRWSSLSFTVRFLIPYFWGICAFVFIATQAPDLENLFFTSGEKGEEPKMNVLYATPIFLGRLLPAGILGILTAAMLAAFMSTHDSYLLCWSSVLTQDVIAPLRKKPLTNKMRIGLTRGLIVVLGIYIWCWGMLYNGDDDIWDYMAITGAVYFTGAFPLLVGGLYWKQASSFGALASLLAGCSALLGLDKIRKGFNSVSQFLFGTPADYWTAERVGLLSVVLTILVFVLGSLLVPDRKYPPKSEQNL